MPVTFSLNRKKHGPAQMVGIDFGSTGVKTVRLQRVKGVPTLMQADILPPFHLDAVAAEDGETTGFPLPSAMRTSYAALCLNSTDTHVRVAELPSATRMGNDEAEVELRKELKLDKELRLSVQRLQTRSRGASRWLTAAMREESIAQALQLFSKGPPALCSIEVAGLSSLNAFTNQMEKQEDQEAVCLLDVGSANSYITFVHGSDFPVLRHFSMGGNMLVERIQNEMGVDRAMAMTMLADGAVDLSSSIEESMSFLLRQVGISRDFVEREHNCRVNRVYLAGGLAMSAIWRTCVERRIQLPVDVFDPFEKLARNNQAVPAALLKQAPRFAAAFGAAYGAMEAL